MAATRGEIERWFDEGVAKAATHMVVVVDTFDHEDYPVYVMPGEDSHQIAAEYSGKNMQRVMEIYILDLDFKAHQLAERRSHHHDPIRSEDAVELERRQGDLQAARSTVERLAKALAEAMAALAVLEGKDAGACETCQGSGERLDDDGNRWATCTMCQGSGTTKKVS